MIIDRDVKSLPHITSPNKSNFGQTLIHLIFSVTQNWSVSNYTVNWETLVTKNFNACTKYKQTQYISVENISCQKL